MKLYLMTGKKLDRIIQEHLDAFAGISNDSYEREILMKQANIQALQSQINPHFLYNALECIRGQALIDGSEAAAEIAQALSRFFRYSISSKSDMVSLKEELENIKSYFTIQQSRFKNRFSYSIFMDDAGETVKESFLPKLTLQPIVENAIQHGFADIVSGGVLEIRIRRIDRHISIVISDNGKGIDAEELENIRETIVACNGINGAAHSRVGILNVDRRIKLHFGDEYGLSINSCPGTGTDVELFFPGGPP
jgi:two-component system sensor histidine kinase YesM